MMLAFPRVDGPANGACPASWRVLQSSYAKSRFTPQSPAAGIASIVLCAELLLIMLSAPDASAQSESERVGLSALPIELIPSLGHRNVVVRVAVSADGRWVLSGDQSGGLNLWDLTNRKLVRSLKGYSEAVTSVSILPDGKRALTTQQLGDFVTLWDLVTGRPILRYDSDFTSPHGLAVSPNGRWAVVASYQKVQLLDLNAGEVVHLFGGYGCCEGEVHVIDVEFASRNDRVFTLDNRFGVSVWSTESGKLRKRYALPDGVGDAVALAVAPDGKRFAVARGSELLLRYSGKTFSTIVDRDPEFEDDFLIPGDVSFFSDSRRVVVQYSERLRVLDAKTEVVLHEIEAEAPWEEPDSVVTLPDDRVVAASEDGFLVWTPGGGAQAFESPTRPVESLAVIPPSSSGDLRIATGGWQLDQVSLWDAESGALLDTLPRGSILHMQATTDGRRLVVHRALSGRPFEVYDLDSKAWTSDEYSARAYKSSWEEDYWVDAIAISSDGSRVATARKVNNVEPDFSVVEIWDLTSGRQLHRHRTDDGSRVEAMESHPTRSEFVILHSDKLELRSWDDKLIRKRSLRTFHPHRLALDPDGKRAYVAGFQLLLVDLDSMTLVNRVELEAWALGVAHTGHADDVVVAGQTPRLRRWDASLSEDRRVFDGHTGTVMNVETYADHMYSVGDDGTLRHWDSETGQLLATSVSDSLGEWITITPDGFLIGSETGLSLLNVVRGRELHAIDTLDHELRQPRLVRERLRRDPEGIARAAASELDLAAVLESGPPPGLEILNLVDNQKFETVEGADLEARLLPVQVAVTDRGGGVGRVEWRVGPEGQLHHTRFAGITESGVRKEVEGLVPIEDFETLVEVTAFNSAGYVAERREVQVRAALSSIGQLPNLYVIAVGVGAYPEKSLSLGSPKWDVLALERALTASKGTLFHDVVFVKLIDEEATVLEITQAFAELKPRVLGRDSFLFYVSAHGKEVKGDLFILPGDFRREVSETPIEAIERQGITSVHLQDWFTGIRARKRIEIYDTCSAAALSLQRRSGKAKSIDDQIELLYAAKRMRRATGNVQIFASQPQEIALDGFEAIGNSLLTHTLLEALVHGDTTGDDVIDLVELADHLENRVPTIGANVFSEAQKPTIDMSGVVKRRSFFIGPKLSALPDLTAERNADPALFRATHLVLEERELTPLDGSNSIGTLESHEWIQVVDEREVDGKVLVKRKGQGVVGWIDPALLLALPD